jgi:hypothetical protein
VLTTTLELLKKESPKGNVAFPISSLFFDHSKQQNGSPPGLGKSSKTLGPEYTGPTSRGESFGTARAKSGREEVNNSQPNEVRVALALHTAWAECLDIYYPVVSAKFLKDAKKKREKLLFHFYALYKRLVAASVENKFEKCVKDELTLIHAKGMGKRLDATVGHPLFSGTLWQLIRRQCLRSVNGSIRSMEFVRSLYEAKRCCLKAAECVELEAIVKHKKIMSSIAASSKKSREWIEKAVDVVFPPGTKYTDPGDCVPTFSACVESNRSAGGNHGHVALDKSAHINEPFNLVEVFSQEQERICFEEFMRTENVWEYQAIPEPLKFRVITKGVSSLTCLRRLQSFLLKKWADMEFSSMVPDFEDRLRHRMESDEFRNDGDNYISGDYSSATDNMHMDATLTAMSRILTNLGLAETRIGMAALKSFSGGTIVYPDGERVRQTRGQLMGHPLSFPLLCIINLSTYMRTLGITRRLDVLRSPLVINGDDILFRGEIGHHDRWRSCSAKVGLEVNEVKTYVHKKFYLINSILAKAGAGKVVYYNRALAIGHGVKNEPVRMVTQADTLWKALEHPRPRAQALGRQHLMETIRAKLPQGRGAFEPNWFVHKKLGGLGLENDGREFRITFNQRKVATYAMRHLEETLILEKLGDKPVSVDAALQYLKKVRPSYESTEFIGPFQRNEDFELQLDVLMCRALRLHAWIKGPGKTGEELRRFFFRKALKSREKAARASTILRFQLWRTRIPNYDATGRTPHDQGDLPIAVDLMA